MLRHKEHHTSVVRLLELNWNLAALTARDAAANTPLDAVDFASEPAFGKPPSAPRAEPRMGHLAAGTAGLRQVLAREGVTDPVWVQGAQ